MFKWTLVLERVGVTGHLARPGGRDYCLSESCFRKRVARARVREASSTLLMSATKTERLGIYMTEPHEGGEVLRCARAFAPAKAGIS